MRIASLIMTMMAIWFAYPTDVIGEKSIECPFPGDEDADMWVLAGQSNMYGSASRRETSEKPDPRIKLFNMDNRWIVATEPIHRIFEAEAPVFLQFRINDGTTHEEYLEARARSKIKPIGGVGPGLFFAKHLERFLDKPLGLIPNSPGGSSMEHWSPTLRDLRGDSLYGAMMDRIEKVGGNVKGLVWYQGESATFDDKTTEEYEEALLNLIDSLRRDTKQPNLPILYVQIGRFTKSNDPVGDRRWEKVREIQRRVAGMRPGVYMVSAIELPLTDHIHINYDGQEKLGRRLAEIALSQVYRLPDHATPIDFESATVIDADTEFPTIRVRFSGVNGHLSAPGRPTGFHIRFPEAKTQMPQVYRIDFDPDDPAAVILRLRSPLPEGPAELIYGAGMNPYVNITDDKDIPIPAFGPLALPREGSVSY